MKRKLTVVSNIVITFILALFGVGCGYEDEGGDEVYMYGTPQAYHTIKGTVKGVNDSKIEGIEVTILEMYNDKLYISDSTQTDIQGKYSLNVGAFPSDTIRHTLSFKDVDGDKNGAYENKTEEVTILRSELEGGEGWNYGSVTKEVNVQLEAKKEEDDEL